MIALIGATLLVVLVVLPVVFDWNWLRPSLERYLSEKSRRSVRIADLDVSFASLDPTVRLRGLFVQNAPWASARPMATAAEASFTFAWRSIGSDNLVIERLELRDADVSMERTADGLRNWRLTRPDDRGPGRVQVMRLDAQRSRIRFDHRGIDLLVALESNTPAAPPGPLTRRIDFSGTWRGNDFSGDVSTSDTLTLRDTGELFPWQGHVEATGARLDVDGKAGDVLRQLSLDSHLTVQGTSLARLQPWAGASLPATARYKVESDLKKSAGHLTWSNLVARVGRSDLTGRIELDRTNDRTASTVVLQGEHIDLADFGRDAGVAKAVAKPLKAAASAADSAVLGPTPKPSPSTFDPARLRGVDADVRLKIGQLIGTAVPDGLQRIDLAATLDHGVLTLQSFGATLAGGRVNASAEVDARRQPTSASARLDWHDVQVGSLLPSRSSATRRLTGPLDGQLRLQTRGDSFGAWVDAASGTLGATMRGGSISNRLDAKLALNGGQWLRAWVDGDDQVPLRCAALSIDVRDGRATLRQLVIDSDKTVVSGRGSADLKHASVDLVLTPQTRGSAPLTLHRSIRVTGPLFRPAVELVDRVEPTGATCRSH